MSGRFTYHGPATIDGMPLPNVRLQSAPDHGPWHWEGVARCHAADTPKGFPGSLEGPQSVPIALPDGRTGQVHATSVNFTGAYWTVGLLGVGPAPELIAPQVSVFPVRPDEEPT